MNGSPRRPLPGASVTSLTPTPSAPAAGMSSSSPAGTATCERAGPSGRSARNAASRAAMASVHDRAAVNSAAPMKRGRSASLTRRPLVRRPPGRCWSTKCRTYATSQVICYTGHRRHSAPDRRATGVGARRHHLDVVRATYDASRGGSDDASVHDPESLLRGGAVIAAETRAQRLESLRGEMARGGFDLAAIAPTDNIRYLLGFSPHPDERACLLLVTAAGAAVLVANLNPDRTPAKAPELELVRWSDDAGPAEALRATLERVDGTSAQRVAADPEMRADHLMLLQETLPEARTLTATLVVGPLREVKDAGELGALQRSSDAADRAMQAAFGALAPGVTELAVADAVARAFAAAGSTPEFAIVGGGPNGAYPHHSTGSRPLEAGDAVVIDIGGRLDGYVSDITRMAFIGEPTERYREIHAIVEAAVVAGMAAARPGATCAEVDAAARGVIADAGYGEYFVHRTGHGLGLSVHEPPWIMRGYDVELRPGVVHSVEPGIYLPGELGVRLEEIVHVTETGCERFSSLSRDVHVVAA